MLKFLKTIGSFLIYKEPKNEERGFELLEGENEGNEQENVQNASSSENNADTKQQINMQQQKSSRANSRTQQKNNQQQGSNTNQQDNNKQQNDEQSEKPRSARIPIKVEDWNEKRKNEKNENSCRPDNTDNVAGELGVNLSIIKQRFDMPKNQDIIIREFKIGRKIKAFMAYLEGMVDKNMLNLSVYPQLLSKELSDEIGEACPVDYLMENVLTVNKVDKAQKYTDIVLEMLSGASALFIEGCNECILLDTRGYSKRNIEQPVTETVVRGSQEGLTEDLRTNLTMIRRIIKNEKLVTEILTIGERNNSNCAIIYLEGIANPEVVEEVKKRINKISTDFVMGDGMIEQFIEDNPFMLFPQILTTERPDRAASFIMEGQVVIIGDGTPFALTVPVTFFRLLQTSEDTFARWPYGTFLRLIRMFGLFCATLLPGLYTAIALFHPEAIPTELLSNIATAKETVPFPTLLEVFIMEIAFELIREGGVRVPSVIGQTLGIVGALILGQAAVSAGLVSPTVVIIVSITALGNFAIPNYSLALAIRIERFFFIFIGAILGMYGISLMIFILAVTACSMKSFGVPFFAPVAPKTKTNPDVIVRYPIWMQKNRPDALNPPNRKRQGENVKNWSKKKPK